MWNYVKLHRKWFIGIPIVIILVVAIPLAFVHRDVVSPASQTPAASVATATASGSGKPCPIPSSTSTGPSSSTTPAMSNPVATNKNLDITVSESGGVAGGVYYNIAFKNTSMETVSMYGYPGVSVVTNMGNQLGKPAGMASGPKDLINIPSGSSAFALLKVTDVGALGVMPMDQTRSYALKIYIPNSTLPVFLPFRVLSPTTDIQFMTITPVDAGRGLYHYCY